MSTFTVTGVPGLPEVSPGDDLAVLISSAAPDLRDGDIVVVTSKIVSKAEGRLLTGVDRDRAIDDETARVVAEWTTERGRTRIAQTRHGFVLAAAGVDASNVRSGTVALLPEDPDGSARRLRRSLRDRLGVTVGVVISDTAGRPWRDGLVDFAVGAAGVITRDDLRGRTDPHGNELGVTVVAVADELAAATELVRTKLASVPVAVVRGLDDLVTADDGPGAAVLVRPAEDDRFRLGTPEAMRAAVFTRRDVASFTAEPIDRDAVRRAIAAAFTAPAPSGTVPWRFALVERAATRIRLWDALLAARAAELRADGLSEPAIADRVGRDDQLRAAPLLIVPCLAERTSVEHTSQVLALGAGVENLLITLGADGLGSRWTTAPLRHADAIGQVLDLPVGWVPMGVVAVGHAADPGPDHPARDLDDYLVTR
jgi:coenzyme F420-0:L-glutamate ligase / coenzyme F420-1:gamma-L-glutamate ligase